MPPVFFIRRKQQRRRTREGGEGQAGWRRSIVSGRYLLILIKSGPDVEAVEVAGAETEVRLTPPPCPPTNLHFFAPSL